MFSSPAIQAPVSLERKLDKPGLRAEVARIMAEHQVPGVSIGISSGSETYLEGFGVTSLDNPLPVLPTTLFHSASLTKPLAATLVMQLVEAGKLNLDKPLCLYLPGLRLAEEDVGQKVTLRHLLTHTAGWVGDFYEDTGPGDEALARYIEKLKDLPQVTPLGAVWSYCNSGYCLIGRVIEAVTGLGFEAAVRQFLLEPLQMEKSTFCPQDILTYSFAVGHASTPNGQEVQRPWHLPRSVAPAGGLISNAPEMLLFARLHLDPGKTPNGRQLLSPDNVKLMQTEQIEAGGLLEKMALGWWSRWAGSTQIISHGGMGIGQVSLLEIIPDLDFALIIFTNSNGGIHLTQKLRDYLYREIFGFEAPSLTPLDCSEVVLSEYTGRYTHPNEEIELVARDGKLEFRPVNQAGSSVPAPPLLALIKEQPDKAVFVTHPFFKGVPVEFLRTPAGGIQYLRFMSKVYTFQNAL